MEVIDGYTIKYHVKGKTMWSKGKMVDGNPDGYWEWYRPDGTVLAVGDNKYGQCEGGNWRDIQQPVNGPPNW